MASAGFDTSELRALAADLASAGSGMAAQVRPVVVKGAVQIKTQLRREMSRSKWFRHVGRTITFDVHDRTMFGASSIEAEIGAVTEGQVVGDLAHLAYFGGAKGGGDTVPDPQNALDAETPRFERALLELLGDIV